MIHAAILYPVFVQVALTFLLMFWMGAARVGSVNAGGTKLKDIALSQKAWPYRVQAISNSFNSQFEIPMLFYALVILIIVTGQVSTLQVNLAWVFVISRILHAAIYVTSNNLRHRLAIFAIGAFIVMIMWLLFAMQIITGN